MGAKTEVAADLKINDMSSAAIGRIKGGIQSVSKSIDKATSGLIGFAKNTASTALGVKLAGFGGTMRGLFDEALAAGKELNAQQKSVASALMMTEKGGRSYDEIRAQANGLQSELQDMAITAGASSDAVIESFNDIASRTSKNTSEVKAFMATMIQAGRVAPGGLASITQGFEQIEMGVVRARNPVVQMIASTGLMQGNARQVAKEMQKMAPDKMMALAERAITNMAKKMEKVPLTFGEAMQSAKEMRGQLFEIVGMPIFKGLAPMMRSLQSTLTAHRGELEKWAGSVGDRAAEGMKVAAEKVKEGFKLIGDNWQTISSSIETAGNVLFKSGKFLVEHQDVIGRTLQMGTGGISNVVGGTAGHSSAVGIGGDVVGGAMAGGKLGGPFGAAMGAMIGAIGAATEEFTALGVLISTGMDVEEHNANHKARVAYTEALKKAVKALEDDVGKKMKYTDSAFKLMGMIGAGGIKGQQVEGGAKGAVVPEVGFTELFKSKTSMEIVDKETQAMSNQMAQAFNDMYAVARESGDAAQMNSVMSLLANSKQLQYALAMTTGDVTAGFNDLIDAMVAAGKMTAEAGAAAKGVVGKKGALASAGATHINASGSTVHVKQEFREADPDRIMVAMKDGVQRAAMRRISARVSSPFGGF